MPVSIRFAGPADAEALAQLHVDVWRETYQGIATDQAIEKLDFQQRLPSWQKALASDVHTTGAIVACQHDQICGVISFGAPGHENMQQQVEIKHLYVDAGTRGMGIGKKLMAAAFAHFRSLGQTTVALAVVEENADARRFYKQMGGNECGRFVDPGPLWRSSNIVVQWNLE